MHTQIGLIAEMLQSVEEEETPLQTRLDQLGKTLGWASAGDLRAGVPGWLVRGHDPLDMFMIAVSLAIAAVPGGPAGSGDHQPGVGYAGDDQAPCPDPQAVLGRNPGLHHGDLLG